jgi:hypothetical protein
VRWTLPLSFAALSFVALTTCRWVTLDILCTEFPRLPSWMATKLRGSPSGTALEQDGPCVRWRESGNLLE